MRSLRLPTAFASLALLLAACREQDASSAAPSAQPPRASAASRAESLAPRKVSVAQVAAGLEVGALSLFDASDPSTRRGSGVIPGAKLLSSFYLYDVEKTLPGDKARPIVFYCASRL
jgi:hypothetical protein